VSSQASKGPDPTVTDGDKYHVIFENDRVRVLRYHDEVGGRTHPHHHPDLVVYALGDFRRRLTLPDGTQRELSFKAGEARFVPDQSHLGENIGTGPTDALLVELKQR
jgi:hypothetical protein